MGKRRRRGTRVPARLRGFGTCALWLMMAVLGIAVLANVAYVLLALVYPQAIHHNHTHLLFDRGEDP